MGIVPTNDFKFDSHSDPFKGKFPITSAVAGITGVLAQASCLTLKAPTGKESSMFESQFPSAYLHMSKSIRCKAPIVSKVQSINSSGASVCKSSKSCHILRYNTRSDSSLVL